MMASADKVAIVTCAINLFFLNFFSNLLDESNVRHESKVPFESKGKGTSKNSQLSCCRFDGHRDWVFGLPLVR